MANSLCDLTVVGYIIFTVFELFLFGVLKHILVGILWDNVLCCMFSMGKESHVHCEARPYLGHAL